MKEIGRHCLCSPKAGITTAERTWAHINVPGNRYRFIQGRNPYHRLVSIFAHKFMDINANKAIESGYDPLDFETRMNNDKERETSRVFNLGDMEYLDITFSTFISEILLKFPADRWQDPHIAEQSINLPHYNSKYEVDDIVMVHDLPEGYLIPAEKLGIDIDIEEIGRYVETNKRDDLGLTREDVINMPVKEWWKLGAIPFDYSLFYNDNLLELVYKYYERDFVLFSVNKGAV